MVLIVRTSRGYRLLSIQYATPSPELNFFSLSQSTGEPTQEQNTQRFSPAYEKSWIFLKSIKLLMLPSGLEKKYHGGSLVKNKKKTTKNCIHTHIVARRGSVASDKSWTTRRRQQPSTYAKAVQVHHAAVRQIKTVHGKRTPHWRWTREKFVDMRCRDL